MNICIGTKPRILAVVAIQILPDRQIYTTYFIHCCYYNYLLFTETTYNLEENYG